MKDISCLIFDFDGTLADTGLGITNTIKEMLRIMGEPDLDENRIRLGIGLPLRESLRIGTGLPEEKLDEAVVTYRKVFDEVAYQYITLFDGVKDTLAELYCRGYRMGIATSRSPKSLNYLVETLGIGQYFTVLATVADVANPKPAPDTVNFILDRLDVRPENTLVIGDTTFDLEMGKRADCMVCGVSYGNHSRERLASVQPDYIIDTFAELSDILLRTCGGTWRSSR